MHPVRWRAEFDPRERDLTEVEEEALDKKEKELTKPIKIRRAISRYQREEALSNPCRSQPVWQDALAGGVFRTSTRLDVESPPPPRVCMSTHPVGESRGHLRFRFECLF